VTRPLAVLVLVLAAPAAAEDAQVDWARSWDAAFADAKARHCPVMLCINSKDGERANETAASKTYRDAEFVARSRKFAMIVVSVLTHAADGLCPRFGKVTCGEHGECYRELRARHGDQFLLGNAEMISPQHAWFRPDGTLLSRREYHMEKSELLEAMERALKEVSGEGGGGRDEGAQGFDAPLSERDRAELARLDAKEKETRRAALGNLLATGKKAAVAALLERLAQAPEPLVCDILRAFGRARTVEARAAIEERLEAKSAAVRSFAAVALEALAQKESVPALLERVRVERETLARKNAYRALGACGGGAADKAAAQALLKGVQDKNAVVAKSAALGLRSFTGAGTALVVKPLERLALQIKAPEVRAAIVYTLAFTGDRETTLPVFRKVLEETHVDIYRTFYRRAIDVLSGNGDFGESARLLFREDRDDPAREDA
jgi:HEAT repeat protein